MTPAVQKLLRYWYPNSCVRLSIPHQALHLAVSAPLRAVAFPQRIGIKSQASVGFHFGFPGVQIAVINNSVAETRGS